MSMNENLLLYIEIFYTDTHILTKDLQVVWPSHVIEGFRWDFGYRDAHAANKNIHVL